MTTAALFRDPAARPADRRSRAPAGRGPATAARLSRSRAAARGPTIVRRGPRFECSSSRRFDDPVRAPRRRCRYSLRLVISRDKIQDAGAAPRVFVGRPGAGHDDDSGRVGLGGLVDRSRALAAEARLVQLARRHRRGRARLRRRLGPGRVRAGLRRRRRRLGRWFGFARSRRRQSWRRILGRRILGRRLDRGGRRRHGRARRWQHGVFKHHFDAVRFVQDELPDDS